MRDLRKARPVAPVRSKYQYFNPNYNVLGLLVEEVSRQPYAEYVKENIFAPLDMEQAFVSKEKAQQAGLAQGYNPVLGLPIPRPQSYVAHDLPAGMIIASAEDMAHYLIAQNRGGCFHDACVLSAEGLSYRIPERYFLTLPKERMRT